MSSIAADPGTSVRSDSTTRIAGRLAFWWFAAILGVLMFAASAPSPLYSVYAAKWHFSSTTLTAVFAVYALALLAALLVAGRLSDYVGRRPVVLVSLAVEIASMACFVAAHSTPWLFAGRVLQGLATGASIGALSAALVESSAWSPSLAPLVNSAAPSLGLGIGALATSALVQYGPTPERLVYWLLLAALAVGTVGMAVLPEPGQRRPGALASLRPQASLPKAARTAFVATLPCLVALWALGGFYLSLGPSLAAALTRSHNLMWGGVLIFLLMGGGSAASVLFRTLPARTAMTAGCLILLCGMGISLGAVASSQSAAFLVGSAVAGVGFGLGFLGVFRTLSALAGPAERGGLITTIYVASYLAFSIPVIVAGIGVQQSGLHDTALVYAAVVAGLTAVGAAGFLLHPSHRRRPALTTTPFPIELTPCPGTVPPCRVEIPTFGAGGATPPGLGPARSGRP